jgi:hypothetical protein
MLLAIATCFIANGAMAAEQVPEHELKAAFIYNFIQFTQWPEGQLKGSTLNVCVSPGNILHLALQAIAGKTAHGRAIALQPLPSAQVAGCHVLVAEMSDRARLPQIRRAISAEAVLTITDDPELMREGFMIGMLVEGNRIAFIVDNSRAAEVKLVISSRLLRLAKSVR